MREALRVLTPKLQSTLAQLPYVPRALALVMAAAPSWTIAWGVLLVLQGMLRQSRWEATPIASLTRCSWSP
ncbi:MAG: Multidrug transporter ATP-binding protein [Chloroflexi bacterium]|nr:Multidrug transporter ATP-binding protein [Chloroflexota bacterium]